MAVLGLMFVPATASAAPDWTSAVTFPVPGIAYGGQAEILYQNGGIATEAFLQVQSLSPLQTTLHVGVVLPGGSYGDQLTIPSSAGAIPASAQIAVAGNGAAVVTWMELTGSNAETSPYRYQAAYRPAGSSTWEAPFTIATDSERNKEISSSLTPVIGPDGTAAVGVQHLATGEKGASRNELVSRLDVAVRPAGGSWQAPTRLSPVSVSAENLALSLDSQGNLTAAYTQRWNEGSGSSTSDDSYTVMVRRRPASNGAWGLQEDISGSEVTWSADAMHLAENEAGDAVVAYQYFKQPSTIETRAATRQGANGSWTTPAVVINKSSAPESTAVASNGMVYILYSYQGTSSAESCEGVVRGPAGGAFSAHRCVSPPNQDTSSGSLALLGNDAYMAWTGNVPGEQSNGSVQGARWPDGTSLPEVARNLDLAGVPYGSPALVNDGDGSVVAFFTNQANQRRASAYDAGAPIAIATVVPETATAGQPASFTSTFVDLWSGLGAGEPTWNFGDGTSTVAGGNATHTFSKVGSYTVTLTAADAFGNTTSSTHTVVVQPAVVQPVADKQAPKVTIALPACSKKLSKSQCKHHRALRSAWQTLAGLVTDPAPSSGIASVQVAIYRTSGKHIEGLSGKHFKQMTKSKARNAFVSAKVSQGHWTLHLPTLKAGSYTILVRAKDRARNTSTITKGIELK